MIRIPHDLLDTFLIMFVSVKAQFLVLIAYSMRIELINFRRRLVHFVADVFVSHWDELIWNW